MTVGFYSPLPPARTGVADYSSALLRHLRRRGQVEITPRYSDVNLYHLGNNQLHAGIYQRALREPGVVVLHDAVLHHFFLGALSRDQYIDEFVYNYGEWSRRIAESLWRTRARSAADQRYFAYPMLRRICEKSSAVIVHNPAARAMVLKHVPNAHVVEIPMLFDSHACVSGAEIEAMRTRLGVNHRTLLAGIFGHLRESKRILPALRAFRRLPMGRAVLLLAGDSGSADLTRAMQPFLRDVHVRRLPYLGSKQFWRVAQATDLCVNLRYPAAGETSAITINFMGIAKPVMLTASDEVSRLPASACVRIAPGVSEEAGIEEMTRWLIAMPQHARDIGDYAAQHIARCHSPAAVADLYWQTLESARC